jgi:hypothetical protein
MGLQEHPKADNDLATTHPDLAAQWHSARNGTLAPQQVTAGSEKRAWWICPKGHEWEARISDRAKGRGCPVCSNKQVFAGHTVLVTTHPNPFARWRPARNSALTPQQVSAGSNKKMWWICSPKGHEWIATVADRAAAPGCPVCNHGRRAQPG